MQAVFLTWRDPETRRWIPVGRLTAEKGEYQFVYTYGAKSSPHFIPFGRMQDLNSIYVSNRLFPLFANRLLPRTRPEYAEYLHWLGLDGATASDLDVLARSGGQRATDTLEIIQFPKKTINGKFTVTFFAHGLRHFSGGGQYSLTDLAPGDHLFLMRDVQNKVDPMALLMRTGDPVSLAGYVPRYYSDDFSRLLTLVGPENVCVVIERVNSDAPSSLRLLCKLDSPWPSEFEPCSDPYFTPIPTGSGPALIAYSPPAPSKPLAH